MPPSFLNQTSIRHALFPIVTAVLALPFQTFAFPPYAEDELLVKWANGPESYAAFTANATIGSQILDNFQEIGWQQVRLPEQMSLAEGMREYLAQSEVLLVQPNHYHSLEPPSESPPRQIVHAQDVATPAGVIPNDPKFKSQWNLKIIGATNAWAVTTGSSNVVVAIIDTGFDYNHPDLAANAWRNPGETGLDELGQDRATNGIDDDGDGYVDNVYGINLGENNGDPMDKGIPDNGGRFYHGTAVAGFIGAVGNNNLGMSGVNWNIQMMAIRAFNIDGHATDATFIKAFEYILGQKRKGVNIRVTNNSYKLFSAKDRNQAVKDVMDALGNEGVLNVVAAANDSTGLDANPDYPMSFDSRTTLCVAASTSSDGLASFSNTGPTTVDLAAPGDGLVSTTTGTNYVSGINGTSFASPHVVGAAALLAAAKPEISTDQIKSLLLGSVDTKPAFKGKVLSNGRLNIGRALQILTNEANPPIVIGVQPAGPVSELHAPIRIDFSRPMDRASTEAAFQIIPPVHGTFIWTNDDQSLIFSHDSPLVKTNHTCQLLASAHDLLGQTLDGNYNRLLELSGADDFSWKFRIVLTNDYFAEAVLLKGGSGNYPGDNSYATLERNEPSIFEGRFLAASVWFQWQASTSVWETFDLGGAGFDSLLEVFRGDNLTNLVRVGASDNYGGRISSRCSFPAEAGTTYYIAVSGKMDVDPLSGTFPLKWYPTPGPQITSFSPPAGVSGQTVILSGTDFTEAFRVSINGQTAAFRYTNENYVDVKLSVTVPTNATSGPIGIETPRGTFYTANNLEIISAPVLQIQEDASLGLVLSWPDSAAGFLLQAADRTGPAAIWKNVSLPAVDPALPGLVRRSDTPVGARFYRLRVP